VQHARCLAGRLLCLAFAPGEPAISWVRTTDSRHDLPIAPNLLDRNFTTTAPNRIWLADITYIETDQGWLYLATVLDLYSRKIVGWAMCDHLRADLPLAALQMAISGGYLAPTSRALTPARLREGCPCSPRKSQRWMQRRVVAGL
jgi:transposase InsO family protein